VAGPATVHPGIADQHDVSADLPCADAALLIPLKRSRAYGAIRTRVADLRPVDAWQEDQVHFFVFALRPEQNAPATPEPPLAVFAMHRGSTEPVSAVVVTACPDGVQAEVRSLREPDTVYTMPLPPPIAEPVSTVVTSASSNGQGAGAEESRRQESPGATESGSASHRVHRW
jgi:hypothetical protein